jgi:hypothetical protein
MVGARQRENRYPRNKKNRSRIGAGGFFAFRGFEPTTGRNKRSNQTEAGEPTKWLERASAKTATPATKKTDRALARAVFLLLRGPISGKERFWGGR